MQRVIRYKTLPAAADENEQLIRRVFAELLMKNPPQLRYAALKLMDGTFTHLVAADEAANNPLRQLHAFREFTRDIASRCEEQPHSAEVTVIGNYRMLQT